jgi:hypothetical protein
MGYLWFIAGCVVGGFAGVFALALFKSSSMEERNMIEKSEVLAALGAAGIKITQCKDCQEKIIFLETIRGKMAPLTMELKSHFADCPNAARFRKK